ncbi:G-PROTEIN-RECEP-F1-2 domain-containing protein [Aphelenchoides besseyi]|nr:G-PROTEIN-RECEP-F1-2 domain-containing protein [Aphelenchoides besseyi]KAI6200488.1 G-PROTEIN-RECEP-F1-2 domain-containing protein [Aphelenchoides besseyi]
MNNSLVLDVTFDLSRNSAIPIESSTTGRPIPVDHPYIVFARDVYLYLVPLMVCVLLLSVLGNCLIVLSAPFLGRSIGPYHRLCLSLAAADAWAGSLLITGLILNSYLPVVMRIQKRSECLAALLEIFRISGMLTSNFHILALALNQFIGILFPLKYKSIVTTRRLRCLILLLWILPIVFVSTWFLSMPEGGLRHPSCRIRSFYNRLPFRLSVFVLFIVPLFGTYIFYAIILSSILVVKSQTAKMRTDRRKVKSRTKLLWTTILIISTFTFSWGLCVLYFVLVCENCMFIYLKDVSFHLGFFINASVNFLVAIKLLLNPLIYAYRLEHVRKSVEAFLRMLFLEFFLGKAPVVVKTKSTAVLSRTTSGLSVRCSSNPTRRPLMHSQPTDLLQLIKKNSVAMPTESIDDERTKFRTSTTLAEQPSIASSVY